MRRLTPFLALTLVACDVADVLRERVRVLTPYERYAQSITSAGLDSTALGRDWLRASDSALKAPLPMALPFREAGFYSRSEARAIAFRFAAVEGQRLEMDLRQMGLPTRLFVDLFQLSTDTLEPFEHLATAEPPDSTPGISLAVRFEVREGGTYLLRMQPELLREGRYEISVRVAPMLAFPVQGAGNRAVQSFFGADRDAGARRHHGIDIFAPRGTAVLAASDGVVRSVSPNNLGGNVVWLADPRRGQTLYYAHLDAHAVRAGAMVRLGDTLGFVGNTGNARGTSPHLHFGIYRRGHGPVDPYPYVRLVTATPARIVVDTSRLGDVVMTGPRPALIRQAPAAGSDAVRSVGRATPLQIVGAHGSWYRVQLATGETGYLVAGALGRALNVRHPADARHLVGDAGSSPDRSQPQ
ncbi:MAG: peptidoglycan DD-metalloendopeptidase family protein [Gemmatimonadaceae bacterium]